MRKFIPLLLAVSFLGMNCATYQRGDGINLKLGRKPGVNLVIQTIEGQQVRGELIAVKRNSLLLKQSESGVDVSVSVREIEVIKIKRKLGVLLGASLGLMFGMGLGYVVSKAIEPEKSFIDYEYIGIPIGAVAGLLLGLVIGLTAPGADKKIQFEGKSDSEIKKILDDLRKKARVPDFP